jgi:hypothetical protein
MLDEGLHIPSRGDPGEPVQAQDEFFQGLLHARTLSRANPGVKASRKTRGVQLAAYDQIKV